MQYPYAVVIVSDTDTQRYVVKANDLQQARRRGLRTYQEEPGAQGPGEVVRAVSLTPKLVAGEFLPRVDGHVVGDPCTTSDAAVTAALLFLDGRRS